MTNREMWTYHTEYQRGISPGLLNLLKGRLADWYKEHGERIKTLNDRLKSIEKSYFEHDENNMAKLTPAEEGKPSAPILLEGKTMVEFNKEVNELMDLQVGAGLIKV